MNHKPFIVVNGIRHPYAKTSITREEVLKLANKSESDKLRVYSRDYNGLNVTLMEIGQVLNDVKQNRFNTLHL